MAELSQELLGSFTRIVRSGGADIRVLADDGPCIRIGFVPGDATPCESGACVLPHVELQEMMAEWLSRRAPERSVKVELVRSAAQETGS